MPRPTIITPVLIAQVEEFRDEGMGTRRIAERLAISRHTVGKIIRIHLR